MFESFNKNISEEDFHSTELKKKDVENALPYAFYNEERIYENMSSILNHFHKEGVKAIFLTWTSASLFGWTLKEAWKKVFPKEKIPDFYFVNPKPKKSLGYIESNDKERKERAIGQNEREEKRIKEILEEIFKKNKEVKIGIFDEAYAEKGENSVFTRSIYSAKDLIEKEMQEIGIKDTKKRVVLDGLGVMDRSQPYVLFEPSTPEVKKSAARKRAKYRTEDYPVIMGKEAIEAFEKIGREIGEKIYKERFEKTLKLNVERHEEIKIESVFKTIPSEKHPETNEDSILNDEKNKIFGVFDGVGGGPAGDMASKTARDYLLAHAGEISDGMNIDMAKEILLKMVTGADEAVYLASKAKNEQKNMSTTASIAKIHTDKDGKNYVLVANVGDSRVYKIDKNKKLQQITEDDSLIGDHVSDREKRLKIEEGVSNAKNQEDLNKNPEISFFFNNRRFITKYLGSRKNNSLKIDAILLVKGDKILITSDGIHDNLATSEIQEIFNSPSNIKEIGEDLINKTIIRSKDLGEMRSKKDDMSFVLIEVK